MKHADAKKQLADYMEGDLTLEQRARVDAHLDGCEDCAREVAELEQTIRLLRSLPEPETPPMIAANVMRRIRAGETEPGFFERMRRAFASVLEPSFMLPASAVAAAALVVVIVQDPGRFGFAGETPARAAGPMGSREALTPMAVPLTVMTAPRGADERAQALARARAREQRFRREVLSPPIGRADASADRPASANALAGGPPPAFMVGTGTSSTGMMGGARNGSFAAGGQAVAVAAPLPPGVLATPGDFALERAMDAEHSGRAGIEDPRDGWIALGLERPADFAGFLAGKSLAEQELWIDRLADRAASRGLLDELVEALESAPGEIAALVAADFSAAEAAMAAPNRTPGR